MRLGLSPDSSSLMRSSLPATYWSRSSLASCCFCWATVAASLSCSTASCCNLVLVSPCSCARSRSERLASEIACSDSASVSAASSLALSVLPMSFLSALSFCSKPARSASAAAFCLLRSVVLLNGAASAPFSIISNSAALVAAPRQPRKEECDKLLGLALVGDGRLSRGDGVGVTQVVVADRLQVLVQFVDQRLAVRDVEADDVVVADAVEHLNQGAQAVAVSRDDDLLAGADGRGDVLVPHRHHARHGVLQAFGQRDLRLVQAGVARVVEGGAVVARFQRRRRRVVAAAPYQHLVVAVLGGGFALVQALQGAVVALVQAPVVLDRQVHHVHLVHAQPQRADRALEHRGVGQVEGVAGLLQHLAGRLGFGDALLGQVHVGPAGEAVREVPGGLAVAHEYDFIHLNYLQKGLNGTENRYCENSSSFYFIMRGLT